VLNYKNNRPDISVVIVNWKSGQLLERCLKTLTAASGPEQLACEVIVINNSRDDTLLTDLNIRSLNLRIVTNQLNVGFAKACNQGADLAAGAYLLFLNPDCELNPTSLLYPFIFLESNNSYAACGVQMRNNNDAIARTCTKLPYAYSFILNALGFQYFFPKTSDGFHLSNWPHDQDSDVKHIIGAFYFIRADVFRALGKFDERYLVYLEDLDLSSRLSEAAWKIRYLASTNVLHVGGGTSSKALAARLYYSLSSRLRYSRKHHSIIGFLFVVALTLFIEPLMRFLYCCKPHNTMTINDIAKAYVWLWIDFGRTTAGRTTAAPR
jgi:GT2 family glycosyltransferase